MVATPHLEIVLCRLWWSQISLFFFTLKEICLCGRVDRKWNDLTRVSLLTSNTIVQIPPDQPPRRISTQKNSCHQEDSAPFVFVCGHGTCVSPCFFPFPLTFRRISLVVQAGFEPVAVSSTASRATVVGMNHYLALPFVFFFQFWISILSRKYITS